MFLNIQLIDMKFYLIYQFLIDFIKPNFRFNSDLMTIQTTALLDLKQIVLLLKSVLFLRKLIQV